MHASVLGDGRAGIPKSSPCMACVCSCHWCVLVCISNPIQDHTLFALPLCTLSTNLAKHTAPAHSFIVISREPKNAMPRQTVTLNWLLPTPCLILPYPLSPHATPLHVYAHAWHIALEAWEEHIQARSGLWRMVCCDTRCTLNSKTHMNVDTRVIVTHLLVPHAANHVCAYSREHLYVDKKPIQKPVICMTGLSSPAILNEPIINTIQDAHVICSRGISLRAAHAQQLQTVCMYVGVSYPTVSNSTACAGSRMMCVHMRN